MDNFLAGLIGRYESNVRTPRPKLPSDVVLRRWTCNGCVESREVRSAPKAGEQGPLLRRDRHVLAQGLNQHRHSQQRSFKRRTRVKGTSTLTDGPPLQSPAVCYLPNSIHGRVGPLPTRLRTQEPAHSTGCNLLIVKRRGKHRPLEALYVRQRKELARTLPAPCVRCGAMVTAEMYWDVDHIPPVDINPWAPAFVAHRRCNRSAGYWYVQAKMKAKRAALKEAESLL